MTPLDQDRPITNADLWAAIRGVRMMRMSHEERDALIVAHRDNQLFASRVIVEAARQVNAMGRP